MPAVSKSDCLYFMNVIDNYTSYVWSFPLKLKSDTTHALQRWHWAVVNQSGHTLKVIVTDNGKLVSAKMDQWCSDLGIDHQHTAPYTSAQNGCAKCLHCTILGRARSMRLACNAPASLWDEFCATAAYLTNLTASSSIAGKTPHEIWFGTAPSVSHLREIECHAFSLIQTSNPKIFRCSTPCTLIGYAPHSKAYHLWDNTTGAIFNSFYVTFIEHLDDQSADLLPGTTILFDPNAPPTWDVPGHDLHIPSNSPAQSSQLIIPCLDPIIPTILPDLDIPSSTSEHRPHPPPSSEHLNIDDPPRAPVLHCSRRLAALHHENATAILSSFSPLSGSHDLLPLSIPGSSLSVDYVLSAIVDGSMEPSVDTNDDPLWSATLASPNKEYWVAGAREELKSLKDLNVFILMPRLSAPNGCCPMRGKLVCKCKCDNSGNITRYKVRYIAKGYVQIYSLDYDKTMAPTAHLESFHILLHIAALLDWDIHQFNIKTVFLNGVLPPDEIAYMEQPAGFEEPGKEDWVMQLSKSIYGMKQASRI